MVNAAINYKAYYGNTYFVFTASAERARGELAAPKSRSSNSIHGVSWDRNHRIHENRGREFLLSPNGSVTGQLGIFWMESSNRLPTPMKVTKGTSVLKRTSLTGLAGENSILPISPKQRRPHGLPTPMNIAKWIGVLKGARRYRTGRRNFNPVKSVLDDLECKQGEELTIRWSAKRKSEQSSSLLYFE